MFTKGDVLVCVDNCSNKFGLTVGKTYISGYDTCVINDYGESIFYHPKRFVSLKEYRKQKLKRICLESETK